MFRFHGYNQTNYFEIACFLKAKNNYRFRFLARIKLLIKATTEQEISFPQANFNLLIGMETEIRILTPRCSINVFNIRLRQYLAATLIQIFSPLFHSRNISRTSHPAKSNKTCNISASGKLAVLNQKLRFRNVKKRKPPYVYAFKTSKNRADCVYVGFDVRS